MPWTLLLGFLPKIGGMLTGINFGAILPAIGGFLRDLANSIVSHWSIWLVAVLLFGNVFTGWEWQHTAILLTKEKAAHAADIASYKQAQAAANTLAQNERAILQKESKADADQADANYAGLATKYHASLLRYSKTPGAASVSGNHQLQSTQSSDGPGSSTDLPATLVITRSDAEICAVNTARLQAVQTWAITLPKEAGQ